MGSSVSIGLKDELRLYATILRFTGVLAGSVDHNVRSTGIFLGRAREELLDKAVQCQMLHAAALLGLASLVGCPGWDDGHEKREIVATSHEGTFMFFGALIFSGSSYFQCMCHSMDLQWLLSTGRYLLAIGWLDTAAGFWYKKY